KRFDATKVHTHTFPLADLPTAIKYARERIDDAIKVVVKMRGSAAQRVAAGLMAAPANSQQPFPLSPHGVKTLAPDGAIKSTGTWNLGTRAGDFVFVAGMR